MYVTTGKNVREAARIIAAGRVVAFPTNTSYGLAADALQGHALQRLRNLKNRPAEKSFTVFLADGLLDKYFDITDSEQSFLRRYKGQALTLLLTPLEPLRHLAQDGRVGLRVIDHPLMQELADAALRPLTATSANKSGQEPCFSTAGVLATFPGKIDDTTYDLSLGYILDGGHMPAGRVSTIVRLEGKQPVVVRAGSLKL